MCEPMLEDGPGAAFSKQAADLRAVQAQAEAAFLAATSAYTKFRLALESLIELMEQQAKEGQDGCRRQ